jgi:hypothetical protein
MIIVLRDPVERAHSNWAHLWSAGLDPIDDFVRACDAEERRAAAGWAEFWHYKQLGLYGQQIQHLHSVFPAEQVLLLRYRHLVDDPAGTLNRICDFLGVSQGLISELPRENVTVHPDQTRRHRYLSKVLRVGSAVTTALPGHPAKNVIERLEASLQQGAAPRRPLTWSERQALIPFFEADVRLLEDITGEDYSGWLQPRPDSGGLVGARPAGQRQARNGRPREY